MSAKEVTSASELKNCIADNTNAACVLKISEGTVSSSEDSAIRITRDVIIDLNGSVLDGSTLYIDSGKTTIKDSGTTSTGKITTSTENVAVVVAENASLKVENGYFEGVQYGASVTNGSLYVTQGTFVGRDAGLYLRKDSSAKSSISIHAGMFKATTGESNSTANVGGIIFGGTNDGYMKYSDILSPFASVIIGKDDPKTKEVDSAKWSYTDNNVYIVEKVPENSQDPETGLTITYNTDTGEKIYIDPKTGDVVTDIEAWKKANVKEEAQTVEVPDTAFNMSKIVYFIGAFIVLIGLTIVGLVLMNKNNQQKPE